MLYLLGTAVTISDSQIVMVKQDDKGVILCMHQSLQAVTVMKHSEEQKDLPPRVNLLLKPSKDVAVVRGDQQPHDGDTPIQHLSGWAAIRGLSTL
jgi:hypothetical protein